MLSREENDQLCRIGPGTVMGDFVRQYWIPFLPSRDLPEPDYRPIKVRLLGEDLIAFRDTNGAVGLMDEPEDSNFKDKVRVPSYPVREVNGALWT